MWFNNKFTKIFLIIFSFGFLFFLNGLVYAVPIPINGVCGTTLNTCVSGTFSDLADTSTNYVWACLGAGTGTTSPTCTIPKAYCTSAGPDDADVYTDTHDIYIYGVGNASSVSVPTWSTADGQDDLVWHAATNLGSGTWKTTIDFTTTHNNEIGHYDAQAYVYDSVGAVFCDTANFTKYNPIDGVCGATVDTCVTGTFSDTPADTSIDYQWTCLGINGGSDSSTCMFAMPTSASIVDDNGSSWIQVPASSYTNNQSFYIMQYNPKKVLQGASYIPVSTATGTIYNNVTRQEAINACQAVGAHLMTNNEWMAVARNLENVDSNWTGGVVGSGAIKQGNAGWDSTGTYNLGGIDSTASNSKARLTLSNGESIWHFSGNIEQFVDQTISKDTVPLPMGGKEFQEVTDWGSTTYSEAGPANTSFTTTQGVGNVANLSRGESPWDDPTSDTFTLARGGWWGYGPGTGIFNWWLYASGNVGNNNIGFRCVSDVFADATCGSADGETFSTEPTTNLCSVGDSSSVIETDTWDWTCSSQSIDSWYNNSWLKRKAITISNSGSTLTDYQVKIDSDIYNEAELAGSWHMNEASGAVAADSSGNSKNAATTGTTIVAGKFGNARSFTASTDTMLISPTISLDSTDYTIETWFQYPLASTASWNTLVRGAIGDHQVIVQRSTMEIGSYSTVSAGFFGSGFIMSTLSNGWHHLAAVGSGSTTAFYIDGEYKGSAAFKSVKDIYSIGNYQGGSQQFGTIDETRVYTRALSSTEIANRYNAKARSDYGDIRFISSDGIMELNHWMEKDGTFWVKMPTLVNGDNTIYMYYENATAASTSNGDNTFDFFDHFDMASFDTNKWTISGSPTISSGIAYINNGQSMTQKITVSIPTILEVKYQRPSYYRNRTKSVPDPSVTDWSDFSPSLYWGGWTGSTLSNNTWYLFRYVYDGAGTFYWKINDYGGAEIFSRNASYSGTSAYLSYASTESESSQMRIDFALARKYTTTEPTSELSSEETNVISSTSCSAIKQTATNGVCGSANTTTVSSIPVNPNLCAVDGGTATDVTTNPTTYTWTCEGEGEGHTDASCYANKSGVRINGACGSSNYTIASTAPDENLCIAGTESSVTTNSTTYTWTCSGINGGTSDACVTNITGEVTNGVCGSSDGQSFTSAPTTNLCLGGIPTTVSGTGPWTWTCNGVGTGATNQSCSSSKALPIWREAAPY